MTVEVEGGRGRSSWFNRDVAAGLFLIVLGAVGVIGSRELNNGELAGIGPGMMPHATGVLVAALGLLILVQGVVTGSERVSPWSFRGTFFVIGAIILFGLTIRELGLLLAGPLAMVFSALAERESRLVEIIPFSIILTVLCIGLFRFALKLPIPLLPFYLGY